MTEWQPGDVLHSSRHYRRYYLIKDMGAGRWLCIHQLTKRGFAQLAKNYATPDRKLLVMVDGGAHNSVGCRDAAT